MGEGTQRVLRSLARGDGPSGAHWKYIWRAAKESGSPIFPGPVSEWDINRLALIHWSSLYDSVYQHPDRPPQWVIEDDDLLDGWLKQQVEENEQRASDNYRQVKSPTRRLTAFDSQEVIVIDRNQ